MFVQFEGIDFADPQVGSQLQAYYEWAAAIVSQHPQAKIGIVIPQLAQQRAKVERIFNRVFEPQSLLPDTPRHASGFNLSAGVPLSSTAVVNAALLALELNRCELTIATYVSSMQARRDRKQRIGYLPVVKNDSVSSCVERDQCESVLFNWHADCSITPNTYQSS